MKKLWIPMLLILALFTACGVEGDGDNGDDDDTDQPIKYECSLADYCEARIECGDTAMTIGKCTEVLGECSGPQAFELCLCACLVLPLSCESLFACHNHCHDRCCPN